MKTLVLLIFISSHCLAQGIDYNKIILPESVQNSDVGERLVQIAWKNHPTNEKFRRQIDIAEFEVGRSSSAWLDIFTVQGNLNEFNINPESDVLGRSQFYPKYNFGARISLGMFFDIPLETKQSRQRVLIAQAELNEQKLEVRRVVLKAYNEYLLREKVYKIQAQQFADAEESNRLVEQKFKNGESTIDAFTLSQANKNRASIQYLEAERDYKNVKIDLEQLIGVRLEEVL